MTKVKMLELPEEAQRNLENAQKSLSAVEIIVALLKENIENTVRENEELREENALLRKQLYEENNPFDWE